MKLGELYTQVAEETKLGKAQVKQAVTAAFAAIRKGVEAGEKIKIADFGTFSMVDRPERTRTSKSGEERKVEARRELTMKPLKPGAGKTRAKKNAPQAQG